MKKKQIILFIIAIFILAGLVFGFTYWIQSIKSPPSAGKEKINGYCAEFPKIEGEISCQEARGIALEKYPGEIIQVDKAAVPYSVGKPPEIKTEDRDVWIIKIKLKEAVLPLPKEGGPQYSTEEAGVVLDRFQGEILFLQTYPLK